MINYFSSNLIKVIIVNFNSESLYSTKLVINMLIVNKTIKTIAIIILLQKNNSYKQKHKFIIIIKIDKKRFIFLKTVNFSFAFIKKFRTSNS